jgi:putative Holliday junction resolvase
VRVLGIDLGRKRIGLALSDASATLARPWQAIATPESAEQTVAAIAAILADLGPAGPRAAEGPVEAVVIGLPRRLSGADTELTAAARDLAARLAARTGLAVHLQDERLSSHEAESRLAVRERDWRRRKAKLDAAAAAVILQDFLDEQSAGVVPTATPEVD